MSNYSIYIGIPYNFIIFMCFIVQGLSFLLFFFCKFDKLEENKTVKFVVCVHCETFLVMSCGAVEYVIMVQYPHRQHRVICSCIVRLMYFDLLK